jgi:hypothetical protein
MQVDGALVRRLDLDDCLRAALTAYVVRNPVKRTANIWGRDPARRRSAILQVAQNYGMSPGAGHQMISASFSEEVLGWTPRQALTELVPELSSGGSPNR